MSGKIKMFSDMLRSGKISSEELTRRYISRIERLNPSLNAYVSQTFDEALKAAARADILIRDGRATSLTGIPMALKDNICSEST